MKLRFSHLSVLCAAIVIAMMASSCHSSKRSAFYADDIYYKPTELVPASSAGDDAASMVIRAATEWLGVPYLYGGNTKEGVDCSGLTTMAFKTGAGILLPRSSGEQAKWGRAVDRSDLRAADLVFFTNKRGGGRINHVAIYVGDGRILHATTSRGVCYSSLDDPYWSTHLDSFRRALP